MKAFIFLFAILAALSLGSTYSKYGRTCRDIGCASNEVCVLKEDPCTRASRHTGCGSYPACQRVNNSPATCSTFVCPPTQRCQITNGAPKCVAKVASSSNRVVRQTHNYPSAGATYPSNSHVYNPNPQYNQQPNYNPQYPNQNNYNNPNQLHNQTHGIYPNLQIGQTSPPNYYQGSSVGGMHQSNQHPNYYPGQGVVGGVNHGNQSPNYHQGQVGVGGAYQPPNYNQGGVQQPQFGQVGQTRPGYPNSGNTAGSNDFYVSQTQGNRQPVGTGGATYPSQGVQGQRYPIQPGYQGGNYQRAH